MAETLPTTVVRYVPIMEVACLSGRRVVIGTLPIGCLLQSLTPQSRILWLKTSTAPQACLRFEWLSKRDMGPASGGVRVVVYTDLLSLYMINRQATVRPDNRFAPRPGGGICNDFPMVLLVRTKLIFGENILLLLLRRCRNNPTSLVGCASNPKLRLEFSPPHEKDQ